MPNEWEGLWPNKWTKLNGMDEWMNKQIQEIKKLTKFFPDFYLKRQYLHALDTLFHSMLSIIQQKFLHTEPCLCTTLLRSFVLALHLWTNKRNQTNETNRTFTRKMFEMLNTTFSIQNSKKNYKLKMKPKWCAKNETTPKWKFVFFVVLSLLSVHSVFTQHSM